MLPSFERYQQASKLSLSVFFGGIIALLFVRADNYVSDWKFTHYLFNYEYGFIKRGLVGELFAFFSPNIHFQSVVSFSYLLVIALSVVLVAMWSQVFFKDRSKAALLLALIAIVSPFTIQHLVYDLGRFDAITALLALATIGAIKNTKGPSQFLLVNLLLSTSLLVHEAAFFMFFPLIFAYWLWVEENNAIISKVVSFIWVLGLTFYISTQGLMTQLSLSEHLAILQKTYGNSVVESSLKVLYKGGLIENIKMTLANTVRPWNLIHHGIMFVLLAPQFYLLFKIIKENKNKLSINANLLLLASLSPLALYPLGHDHFRWWSLAITNVFVVLFLLMQQPQFKEQTLSIISKHSRLVYFIIVSSVVLGPIGITSSFDSVVDMGRWLLK
ncbi:hypothetical protein [Alteromonas sp. a30]|uniref:hypothetical protein n=1 Tax=Alteromonas sp. a30 TaxID=2730917 RepID=UPI002280C28D|nr:hypothetical protein [Alteromonas sp. a30]MCY7295035.1 hypothetical protein [Alteromonas sp. a30]